VAWPVPFFMPGPARVSTARAEEPGRRRAGRGLGSREPSPLADHPPHGEGAPHLRDGRDGQPCGASTLAVGTRPSPPEYAATRARRTINLKAIKNSNDDLWAFVMLPDGPLVSGLFPLFLYYSSRCRRDSDISSFPAEGGRERSAVRPAHASSPSARAAQRREQERAARKKERGIRRQERREQRDEEFRLCEQ
jgi:hypothetical protein